MKRRNVSRGKQRELGLTVTPPFERAKNGVAVGLKYLETWWRQQEHTCNRWNLDIEWLAYFTLFEPKKNFIVRHSVYWVWMQDPDDRDQWRTFWRTIKSRWNRDLWFNGKSYSLLIFACSNYVETVNETFVRLFRSLSNVDVNNIFGMFWKKRLINSSFEYLIRNSV